MADIKPFAAYRPAAGRESEIAALPYDVYSREEACAEVSAHPSSFLAIDRAETQFPDSVGTYDDCVYEKAAELLNNAIKDGSFVQDETPCYYLYEQVMNGRVQTGIVACASIDDYQNEVIKKHENTRKDKQIDRIRHVDSCDAQTGPIFLCYREDSVISETVAKVKSSAPYAEFISEGEIHNRLWVIRDPEDVEVIQTRFSGIDKIYIADGHHRCASAVEVGLKRRAQKPDYTGEEEFNYFLCVLFPKEELMIMDYNRVVENLFGYTPEEFLIELSHLFMITERGKERVKPGRKSDFGLYMNGKWYLLRLKDRFKREDPVDGLDVSILQDNVLRPILGIEDPRTDSRIRFVGGIRGLEELERLVDGGAAAAFSLYPTSMDELLDVADAGRLVPPKSTWFEPKLLSGLFIHKLS